MKIYLASDHAGFGLKEELKKYFGELKYEVRDFGAFEYEPEDDYPDFIFKAADAVAKNPGSRGIILGGSGIGECIVANKVKGVRAVRAWDETSAKMSRRHNDTNVLCLGGGKTVDKMQNVGLDFSEAKKITDAWFEADFSKEPRHARRLGKIKKIFNE